MTVLTGWGRTAPSVSEVAELRVEDLAELIRRRPDRGLIGRGLGRSYGDAAQNAGGIVLAPILGPTTVTGSEGRFCVSAAAGTSLDHLIPVLLKQGLFVPVTPGTRQATLAGAVATDVHGKNHHRDGSFGDHVVSLDLVTADGRLRTVGPDREPDVFWATVGGMGLTGVITSVTFRAVAVESAYLRVRTERLPDLPTLLSRMRETDGEHRYSVAWVDTMARGRALGRSVLTQGDHARAVDLDSAHQESAGAWHSARMAIPAVPPSGLVSRPVVRAFNELWFRKSPSDRVALQSISTFFHPLDTVKNWNRLYGRTGLVQYQFVVPDEAEDAVKESLRLLSEGGHPSFLTVLKRFGQGNAGLLSFPRSGWTLALDLPADPVLVPLFRRLDELVVAAGGRVYLAKDSRLAPQTFFDMYDRAGEFRRIRSELDPDAVFRSDLARRLQL